VKPKIKTLKKFTITLLAVLASSSGTFAQNVNIPDANFKAYLVSQSSINTNADSEIQVSEATSFNGTIDVFALLISDLTGIEAFTNLTKLNCPSNNLTALDVSQNTALTELNVSDNKLTALDVSQNTLLVRFFAADNNLTALDISQNTLLKGLELNGNDLSSLDVSSCTGLDFFDCRLNDLTTIKMNNISPSTLTYFDARNNPNLTCIQVDDIAVATAAWTNIDVGVAYSLNCQATLVNSITVQGHGGASVINTKGGVLQMEASVLPASADDTTYTWSVANGTGSASINATGLLTAISDGTVLVTATANDASGVSGSATVTISNQSTGINKTTLIENISVYPNPVIEKLNIEADGVVESMQLINITGNTVKTFSAPVGTIDMSDMTKGIYFLQIHTAKGTESMKVVKN